MAQADVPTHDCPPQEVERIRKECKDCMDTEALAQLDMVIETLPAALGAAGDSLAAPEEPPAAAPVPAAPAADPLPAPSLARPAATPEQQSKRSGGGGGGSEAENRSLAASSHRNSQSNMGQGWASPARDLLDKRPPSFHELQRVMQDYHDQQQVEQSSRLHASSSQVNGHLPNGR